ncbi:TetR/AcrR family transcriptional regulator [Nocardia callitridis]|uniref:TetR family transcriptional regulator n=1 Tax=Nocardia callitridis TaxID=648753 RepID=A0ABP9KUS8_9NOCA
MEAVGLRELKKRRTRAAILEAAFALFERSGFDGVSVADIAAAAEVSKPTLFAYFPTKEDLVLHRFLDGENDPALIVRHRDAATPPLRALRQNFLDRLTQRDPRTGLNDDPAAVMFHDLLYSTPSLMARLSGYMLDRERDLTDALLSSGWPSDEFTARLVAAQIFAAQRILSNHNARAIRAGRAVDDMYPTAVANADQAFDVIENGHAPRSD